MSWIFWGAAVTPPSPVACRSMLVMSGCGPCTWQNARVAVSRLKDRRASMGFGFEYFRATVVKRSRPKCQIPCAKY